MLNEPTDAEFQRIPPLYSTMPRTWEEMLIYEHFFVGAWDFYIAEWDSRDRRFWAFAIFDVPAFADWRYLKYDDLREIRVGGAEIDRDLNWRIRKASEIEKVVAAHQQRGGTA